jgi:hypothetical protein
MSRNTTRLGAVVALAMGATALTSGGALAMTDPWVHAGKPEGSHAPTSGPNDDCPAAHATTPMLPGAFPQQVGNPTQGVPLGGLLSGLVPTDGAGQGNGPVEQGVSPLGGLL